MMNNQAIILNSNDRMRITVALELYLHTMREACAEDQGIPEGKPGTIGHDSQIKFKDTLERFKTQYPVM